jgi:hypothetical protein
MATTIEFGADTEQHRRQLMSELVAEQGPDWCDSYKPGTFGCHELLDRTALAAKSIEDSVLAHPACVQSAEWFALADHAVSILNELYQRIGADHLAEKNGDTTSK